VFVVAFNNKPIYNSKPNCVIDIPYIQNYWQIDVINVSVRNGQFIGSRELVN